MRYYWFNDFVPPGCFGGVGTFTMAFCDSRLFTFSLFSFCFQPQILGVSLAGIRTLLRLRYLFTFSFPVLFHSSVQFSVIPKAGLQVQAL